MEQKQKKYLTFAAVYSAILLLLLLIVNLDGINAWLGRLFLILRPVIFGLGFAYLCNPLFRLYETKLFFRVRPLGLRRTLSLILTYLTVILIFVLLALLIFPQLIESIVNFLSNYEKYLYSTIDKLNGAIAWINGKFPQEGGRPLISKLDPISINDKISNFFYSHRLDKETLLRFLSVKNLSAIFGTASRVLSVVTDILFGIFISLYFLNSKEKRYAQVLRLRTAFLGEKVNAVITEICTTADRSFGNYIKGKLLDSTLVALIVYLLVTLFQIPYAILIAVFVGITDVIPVIGPFIGVIPTAVIVLLTDPVKVIPYLLIILVVQQLDGNIMAPKILGANTGISTLCVLIVLTVMGSLWGLFGMVLGVPLVATILELTDYYLNSLLRKKGLPCEADEKPKEQKKSRQPGSGGRLSRLFRHLRRKVLRIPEPLSDTGTGDLTQFEQFQLQTYALARKYRIFSEPSEEVIARFSSEESALQAAVEIKKRRTVTEPAAPAAEREAEKTTAESVADAASEELSGQ